MRSPALVALLFVVVAPLAGFAEAPPTQVDGWEAVRIPARPFEVKGLRSQALRLADLAGTVVVIELWASRCQPCIQELPERAADHRRLAGRSDALVEPLELAAFPTNTILDARRPGPDGSAVVRFRREGLVTAASIEARVAALLAEP